MSTSRRGFFFGLLVAIPGLGWLHAKKRQPRKPKCISNKRYQEETVDAEGAMFVRCVFQSCYFQGEAVGAVNCAFSHSRNYLEFREDGIGAIYCLVEGGPGFKTDGWTIGIGEYGSHTNQNAQG